MTKNIYQKQNTPGVSVENKTIHERIREIPEVELRADDANAHGADVEISFKSAVFHFIDMMKKAPLLLTIILLAASNIGLIYVLYLMITRG